MCIQQIHFQNTIVKEEHLYPININGNVSYEGNLKHGKYKCDSLVSCFFLFTRNRDIAIARESFSFKTILRSSWYNIIYHLTFLWFLFDVVFLTTIFPSQLDLSIVQAFFLPYWSTLPMLVSTISREVRSVKQQTWNVLLATYVWIHISYKCDHHNLLPVKSD